MWLRALVVGLVGLASGTGSHLLGRGLLPGAGLMVVLALASILASGLLLLRWASTTRLVVLVIAAQTGWHLVLSAVSGHAGAPAPAVRATPVPEVVASDRTGSLFDAYAASLPEARSGAADGTGLLAHQIDHLAQQGPWMVLAHVLGAAALGLFLARGEHALVALLALGLCRVLAAVCPRVRPLVTRLVPRARAAGLGARTPVRLLLLVAQVPRRGPPALRPLTAALAA